MGLHGGFFAPKFVDWYISGQIAGGSSRCSVLACGLGGRRMQLLDLLQLLPAEFFISLSLNELVSVLGNFGIEPLLGADHFTEKTQEVLRVVFVQVLNRLEDLGLLADLANVVARLVKDRNFDLRFRRTLPCLLVLQRRPDSGKDAVCRFSEVLPEALPGGRSRLRIRIGGVLAPAVQMRLLLVFLVVSDRVVAGELGYVLAELAALRVWRLSRRQISRLVVRSHHFVIQIGR